MEKLNSSGSASGAAAKAPGNGKPSSKRRRRDQYWFGLLNHAVSEDQGERGEPPDLSAEDVLAWADAFRERTGDWPTWDSGPIPEAPGETWFLVAAALCLGLRGFPPGGSIPRFLDEHRGRYNCMDQKSTMKQVLAWADAWYARTGDWPCILSGVIPGSGGVTWRGVDRAFRFGRGMLRGGSSLARVLASRPGVVRHPPLTEEQILAWADAHHRRTGKWPCKLSGPITEAPQETWLVVDTALYRGRRGLAGGSSLARLLVARRQARYSYGARLTIAQVLAWADLHHARTGRWPNCDSGPVLEAPGERWQALTTALSHGFRGLPGGSTLTQLLIEHRGIRSKVYAPPLVLPQILAWADAFHARNGRWPVQSSGPVIEAPGENWCAINRALSNGIRGLPGGSSLSRLLARERAEPGGEHPRPITIPAILQWADAYKERHGRWPERKSGPVPEAPGESWSLIQTDLASGRRGLPGGSSIARLLSEHRGRRHKRHLSDLTVPRIVAWIHAFHARTGRWPTDRSGAIPKTPGETWLSVSHALKVGRRGLPGGLTLARLLDQGNGEVAAPRGRRAPEGSEHAE